MMVPSQQQQPLTAPAATAPYSQFYNMGAYYQGTPYAAGAPTYQAPVPAAHGQYIPAAQPGQWPAYSNYQAYG